MPPTPRNAIRLRRTAFIVYTIVLLYATHRPQLTIDGPVARSDLYVHVLAFGLWTALLWGAGARTRAMRWRMRYIALCAVIGLAFGATFEATQAIPLVGRQFDVTDMAANAVGALAVACMLALASRFRAPSRPTSSHG